MNISNTEIRFSDIKPGDVFTWMNIGPYLKITDLSINIYGIHKLVNAIYVKEGTEAYFDNDCLVTLVENPHDNC